MFNLIACRLLAAVLAVSIIGSPVVAGMSTCCRRTLGDAIKSEHACCCATKSQSAKGMGSCCAADEAERPCCAKKRLALAQVSQAPAPCCCKARQCLPAAAELRHRFDSRNSHFIAGWTVSSSSVGRSTVSSSPALSSTELLPGVSLQKLHCHWTV
jgi:hypothetical protein